MHDQNHIKIVCHYLFVPTNAHTHTHTHTHIYIYISEGSFGITFAKITKFGGGCILYMQAPPHFVNSTDFIIQ